MSLRPDPRTDFPAIRKAGSCQVLREKVLGWVKTLVHKLATDQVPLQQAALIHRSMACTSVKAYQVWPSALHCIISTPLTCPIHMPVPCSGSIPELTQHSCGIPSLLRNIAHDNLCNATACCCCHHHVLFQNTDHCCLTSQLLIQPLVCPQKALCGKVAVHSVLAQPMSASSQCSHHG